MTAITTDELVRRTRSADEHAPHTSTRQALAVAAARGWIVQDTTGTCWWADDDGRWYPQRDAAALITRTMTSDPGR